MKFFVVGVVFLMAGCVAAPIERGDSRPDSLLRCFTAPCSALLDPVVGYVREPMLTIDPRDPLHMIVAAQDQPPSEDAWDIAEVTWDGGRSWTRATLPGGPKGDPMHPLATMTKLSDPIAVILHDGTVLYAGLASHAGTGTAANFVAQGVSLFIARSFDGGLTYPDVRIIAERPGVTSFVYVPTFVDVTVLQDDKPWFALGPKGEVFLVWSDHVALPARSQLVWSITHDAGESWSEPAVIEAEEGVYWGVSPVITRDGAWHVLYVAGGQEADGFHYDMRIASSVNAGLAWTFNAIAREVPFQAPQLAYDTETEDLVAVFSEGPNGFTFADLVLLRLPAATTTWTRTVMHTPPRELALDSQPSIAIGPGSVAYVSHWRVDSDGASARHLVALRGHEVVADISLGHGRGSGEYAGLIADANGAYVVWSQWPTDVPAIAGARLVWS